MKDRRVDGRILGCAGVEGTRGKRGKRRGAKRRVMKCKENGSLRSRERHLGKEYWNPWLGTTEALKSSLSMVPQIRGRCL